jgi:hypothetical protein
MVVVNAIGREDAREDETTRTHADASFTQLYCPFDFGVNPHASAVQAASVQWAARMGFLRSEAQQARLEAAKVAWLEAFVFNAAPREALQLAADWTTLFCLLDDFVESEQLGPIKLSVYFSRLLATFRAPNLTVSEPIARGLADVSRRLEALGGASKVSRFAQLLDELFGGYIWEEINRWKQLRPSYDTYRSMRVVTIGLRPQFALAEILENLELSEEARKHPDLMRLERTTCRAVGWANDLFTYEKELEQGEVHNLVLVLMHSESLPLCDALRQARAAHDDEVRAFLSLEARLTGFGDEAHAVRRYVAMLRRWIRGHLDWAVKTGRYQERRSPVLQ